jgi:ribonuclease Y
MELVVVIIVSLIAGLGTGAGILYLFNVATGHKRMKFAEQEAERIMNKAKSKAGKIEREANFKAKDFENRAKRNAENDIRKQKQSLQQTETNLKDREGKLEREYKRKEEELVKKIKDIDDQKTRITISEERIKKSEGEISSQMDQLRSRLEKVAQLTTDEARQELERSVEDEARRNIAQKIQELEKETQKEMEQKSRQVLATAIARYASEVSTERTVSIVPLTSDEMKGKIIGREGRNIRALEAACGVDLIIDETPEAVVISSFDPVRREVAKLTLERLMEDGRVHPARIEEVVEKAKQDIIKRMKSDGEQAAIDLGLINIRDEILHLVGSLRYRTTQTYNVFKQSIEVAYVAGMIADEIGFDAKTAKRAGLLHAIGRAIDHTVEGSYAKVGSEFARKHGERDEIVSAIRCHNGEKEARTLLDHIIQAAFNLAEARPGVRRQMMETYVQRLSDLESVANSFDGVQKTFAIHSGKEIRVLVDGGKITDGQSEMLSRDIARKIEKELSYSGQVKVSVIRETRIVEHAR